MTLDEVVEQLRERSDREHRAYRETSLDQWRRLPKPASRWRLVARAVIREVVSEAREVLDPKELLARVDAAYPFGERKYEPYKCWLAERTLFRDALVRPALPTTDEIGVCEVARDLVEVGAMGGIDRTADVTKLLEQAPNRLARRCPVCCARPGAPCLDLESAGASGRPKRRLLVPHHARLVGVAELAAVSPI